MSSSDYAIRIKNIGKQYRIGLEQSAAMYRYKSLRDLLGNVLRAPMNAVSSLMPEPLNESNSFWALKDVSFDVKKGEVIGIIGRNGAGKSTLLKILSRITRPTTGETELHGRVGSLLEVGTGFHPELSGRENIYLNGAVLGMTHAEVKKKFDEIVAFSEIEKFLDTPVKQYSSGMYMRLAFAVAAHLEPEILVVDEVLAVGDAAFQKKCLGKMRDVAVQGRTVIFVSHNMAAISELCGRVCILKSGEILFEGLKDPGLMIYGRDPSSTSLDFWERNTDVLKPLGFTAVNAKLVESEVATQLVLELNIKASKDHSPAFLAVDISDVIGAPLMQALPDVWLAGADEYAIRINIHLPPLVPGEYRVSVWIGPHNSETYDSVESAVSFEVLDSPIKGRTFPYTRDHGSIVPSCVYEWI